MRRILNINKRALFVIFWVLLTANVLSQSIYQQAVQLYEDQRYEEAIPLFREYLEELHDEEKIIDSEEYIADSYNELDQIDLASEWASKILKKDSLNRIALIILLRSSALSDDFKSIKEISTILIEKLDENMFFVYYLKAVSHHYFEENLEALYFLNKAYEMDSDYPGINLYLGSTHFRIEEYDQAIPFFLKSIMLEHRIEDSYYGIASSYFNMENHEKSLEFMKIIEEQFPEYTKRKLDDLEFLYMLGESYYNFGDYKKALYYLEQIKDQEFKDYERVMRITIASYDELSKSYSKKGEHEKAAYFVAKKAETSFKEGYIEQAIRTIDEAIEIDSSIHYTLFKAQVMMFKIVFYFNNDLFENKQKAYEFSLETKDLIFQVYSEIFAIDPNNEDYLNRYLDDLFFLDDIFDEPEILEKICSTFEKLESLNYEYNIQVRNIFCNDADEKYKFDYNIVVFDLESFEQRFNTEKGE